MNNKRLISYTILTILLILRITGSILVFVHDDILSISTVDDPIANWDLVLYGLFLFGSFSMVAIGIGLNQENLESLNIDRFYIILLLAGGLTGLYYLPYNCFSLIAAFYLLSLLFSKRVTFVSPNEAMFKTGLWIVGIFSIIFLSISSFLDSEKIQQNIIYFLTATTPISIFEEAIYRGFLILLLRDLMLSETKIWIIQAFVFWISHINYVVQAPIFFWLVLPAIGLILGCLVLRTKSISISAVAHILMNVLTVSISLS